MYSVVIFTEENKTAVVPSSWLRPIDKDPGHSCLWPPFKPSKKQIIDCCSPEDGWMTYPCRFKFSAGN